ncbi:MAG: CehA/McbA family metallohydrolase [Candidatus Brocadiia bacterium]
MPQERHDRIFPLRLLNDYPGTECLDSTFFLPRCDHTLRRVWAQVPTSTPTISVDDVELEPAEVHDGPPRWIDYGTAELPVGFSQLRVRGLRPAERAESVLVVAEDTELSLATCSREQAERKLWGLARADAGSTTICPSRVQVGRPVSFRLRYTAGKPGLPKGARVRLTVPKGWSRPQADEATKPGFVQVTDGEAVIEEIADSVESHEKVDIFCRLPEGFVPFGEFELTYSTYRTYIYPTTFHGAERRYWYSKVSPLSAAVSVGEGRPFVSLTDRNTHSLEFVPGPAERLFLFLPGRQFTSDEIVLRGTFTDHYRNVPPAEPIRRDVELWLVHGEERTLLGSPEGHFEAPHRFSLPLPELEPGVYRVLARLPDSHEVLARSNPLEIVEDEDETERVWWGEIHGHTEMSDGCGRYDELYRHAREEGRLDFAAAADHACYHSDNQWLWMQDITNSWNEPGRFVTLIGYEWAGQQVHRNVYTSRDRLRLFRGMYEPTATIDVVWEHFEGDEQIVGAPHAPLAHGLVWEHHLPDVERFVEVYSMWGASDFRDNPLVPRFARENPRGMTVNELLQDGARLGFTGGGDCHEGHVGFSCEDPGGQGITPHTFAVKLLYRCGMTAAVMRELDRRSLLKALRNRRTYATTGARILLEFTAAGLRMGDEGMADEVECRATVHGEDVISLVEIIKDGEVAWSRRCDDEDVELTWQDPEPPTDEHYYYLHVVQDDGQMAWSSPVWVMPIP